MTSDRRRLRKYARKKRRAFASRNPRLEAYLILYWRYHHRVHGPVASLWEDPA